MLSDQTHDAPAAIALLKMSEDQRSHFEAQQAAPQKNS